MKDKMSSWEDKMSPREDKMMAIAPPLTSQTGHRHGSRSSEETPKLGRSREDKMREVLSSWDDKMSLRKDLMMAIAPPLTSQTGHRHGSRFEEATHERLSSSSAPLVDYGPWDAVGRARRYLIESLVWHLFLVLFWCRRRSSADYDMEEGGQALPRVGGGAAAPVQQPSEVSQRLDAVMVQALSAFLPACVTAYPLLKDAPDYIKFTIFGGLAVTTLGLFVGTLSNSVARRGLAIRLVSFLAIAVLTFCTASQFSSRIYVALTALIGVVLNLIIMLLRF